MGSILCAVYISTYTIVGSIYVRYTLVHIYDSGLDLRAVYTRNCSHCSLLDLSAESAYMVILYLV